MTTPKERQCAIPTIAPGVFYTRENRYLIRVTFSPAGVFHEASILLDREDDFDDALDLRDRLRERLIMEVAPTELLDENGETVGVVFANRVCKIRPPRKIRRLPPSILFEL